MPNFDGGHYFLTVLAPLRPDVFVDADGGHHSREAHLRKVLACLPTAEQGPASIASGLNSPFARDDRTHFTRFTVISDVIYNGRTPSDAILSGVNPLTPQKVDRLQCPYLMWAVDFDAETGSDAELRDYLKGLWQKMEPELRLIFENCRGFETVNSDLGFADYVMKCQVETTMPFNDYWANGMPAKSLPLKRIAGVTALVGAAGLWLAGIAGWPWYGWLIGIVGLVALVLAVLYAAIVRKAAKPFPTAPHSDLRSVLKALYLQRHFVDFAVAHQGADAETLYNGFAKFVTDHDPMMLDVHTQKRGVIGEEVLPPTAPQENVDAAAD